MENTLRATLLAVASAFADAEGCALSTVSRRCRNDSAFFRRIADTGKSFTARTFDEVMQWFSDNWPAGHEWPDDIERPTANAPSIPSHDSTAAHGDAASPDPIPETSAPPPPDHVTGDRGVVSAGDAG